MARSIDVIEQSIIDAKNADANLSGLTSTSATAVWRRWVYITARAINTMEVFMDSFKTDVAATIAAQKPHTLQWYITKAKAFQYGVSLPADTDTYAVVPPVDASVLVVANAAAIEIPGLSKIRIKAARLVSGVLAPLTGGQLAALNGYMSRVKDAGVRLECTSSVADNFRLSVNVYYDALVIDASGARIDGTSATPVKDAIITFLDGLPFNGVFDYNTFVASISLVEGVKVFECLVCEANYGSTDYIDIIAAMPSRYTPDAGYMTLDVAWFAANVEYVPLVN